MRTKTINERVNLKAAKYLSTLTLQEFKDIKQGDHKEKDLVSEHNTLIQYCKAAIKNKGVTDVTYKSKTVDRLYCPQSVQGVSKRLKGLLLAGLTTDIDVKNCHPKLLEYICKKNGVLVPGLECYNNNRDAVIAENPGAKEDVISYINGSNKKPTSPFMKRFKLECASEIHGKLIKFDKFKELVDNTKTNQQGALTFRIMEQLEVEIIHNVVIPWLEDNNYEIAVVMHDGVHVYGDLYSDNQLLVELEKVVEAKYPGLNLKFAYKEHSTLVKIPEDFVEAPSTIPQLQSYAQVKEEFERTHFKKWGADRGQETVYSTMETGSQHQDLQNYRVLSQQQ